MFERIAVVAVVVAGLSAPTPASASPTCAPIPVSTVGAHIEVGNDEIHVPALANARLCFELASPTVNQFPATLSLHSGCGVPCFTLTIPGGEWEAATTHLTAYVTYDADGSTVSVPLMDDPVSVTIHSYTPVCFAMGSPIPECPEQDNLVEVPIPFAL